MREKVEVSTAAAPRSRTQQEPASAVRHRKPPSTLERRVEELSREIGSTRHRHRGEPQFSGKHPPPQGSQASFISDSARPGYWRRKPMHGRLELEDRFQSATGRRNTGALV